MLDEDYYEGVNINDEYGARKDVKKLLDELKMFDLSIKKFFGPKKVKSAATDARRNLRIMKKLMKQISDKIQSTRQDYEGDYS